MSRSNADVELPAHYNHAGFHGVADAVGLEPS